MEYEELEWNKKKADKKQISRREEKKETDHKQESGNAFQASLGTNDCNIGNR